MGRTPSAMRLRRAPVRARRTHAERTAETRAKILAAAVESIAEVGLQRSTAVEIARRVGITWGAVQHHFGGKNELLMAVLETSFEHFAMRLRAVPIEGLSLEARAARFVERAWEHFASREYASTFEILLDHLRRTHPTGASWQERMSRAWDGVWRRFFGDATISRRRHGELQHYTISVLSGLASTLMLEGRGARVRAAELALLAATLTRELGD